jgi:hypothetical protein
MNTRHHDIHNLVSTQISSQSESGSKHHPNCPSLLASPNSNVDTNSELAEPSQDNLAFMCV